MSCDRLFDNHDICVTIHDSEGETQSLYVVQDTDLTTCDIAMLRRHMQNRVGTTLKLDTMQAYIRRGVFLWKASDDYHFLQLHCVKGGCI